MNRQTKLNRLITLFARFKAEVEGHTSQGFYDINIHSENVLIPLLNAAFDWELINANFEEANKTAIDLIDRDARVCIQVTSTSTIEKIKSTLSKYCDKEYYKEFDTVFFYFLRDKPIINRTSSIEAIESIVSENFDFTPDEHLLDNQDITTHLNQKFNNKKLVRVLDLLEEEFSEEKVQRREYLASKIDEVLEEEMYSNMVKVDLPKELFSAEINFSLEEAVQVSWQTQIRLKKRSSDKEIIQWWLENQYQSSQSDWVYFDGRLYTFSNFEEMHNSLNKIIDKGSIEVEETKNLSLTDFKYIHMIRMLLKSTLIEKCKPKSIEILKNKLFRFMIPDGLVMDRKITWKHKRSSERKVVYVTTDEVTHHYKFVKHLAFTTAFDWIDNHWWIIINPDWSFSYDGVHRSYSEDKLLSQQKRSFDKNNTIRNDFLFIAYCLKNKISENDNYPFLDFHNPEPLILKRIKG